MPLPDIDSESWQGYSADRFAQQTDQRIGALTFGHAADSRIADLGSSFTPPTPSDSLTNPMAAAAPQPPEPAPLPEPVPAEAAPPELPAYVPGAAPLIAPAPPAPTAPVSLPFPTQPSGQASFTGPPELIGQALEAANQAGVDPKLFLSLIQQESNWNPTARSPVGAGGLSQLMPETARGLGVTDVNDVGQNLMGGAKYLKQQIDKFGGNVVNALAAYNAGPGAVEKYGGVPPYEETQRYVSTILGRIQQEQGDTSSQTGVEGSWTPGPTEGLRRVGSGLDQQQGKGDISQFGDPQLTADEAYTVCGPAAAVRFAQRFGRNPSLREATDLAKTVGGTFGASGAGMAGLGSEKALMDKLGVPTKLVPGAQWDVFSKEAQTGNPVTISTTGHYFTADGFNPDTGAFHVGRSGLDLKGGKEWMTPGQMTAIMGAVQGGLLADNPQVPTPSIADQDTNPLGWLGRSKDALASSIGGAADAVTGAISDAGQSVRSPVSDAGQGVSSFFGPQPMAASQQPTPSDTLTNPTLQTAPLAAGGGTSPQPTVFDAAGGVARAGLDALGPIVNNDGGREAAFFRDQAAQDALLTPEQRQQKNLETIQASYPHDVGGMVTGFLGGGDPNSGINMQQYQEQQAARRAGIEQINPVQDPTIGGVTIPGVRGAVSMAGDVASDPLTWMGAFGAAGRVGGAVESALGGGLRGTVANQATQGALLNVIQAAQQPGATPQDIAVAAAQGAALGGVTGGVTGGLGKGFSAFERAHPPEVAYGSTFEGEAARDAAAAAAAGEGSTIGRLAADEGGGKQLSTEEAVTLYDNLGQQWEKLGRQAQAAEDQGSNAFNPGLKARYQNEANSFRAQQDVIQQQADHLMEHGSLPVDTAPSGALPEQAPAAQSEVPFVVSDAASAHPTEHLFGEMTAAKKAGTLPGSGNGMPAGAQPIEMTRAEQIARLKLEKFPEEVRGAIQQAAEARDFGNTQRRGVISDATSEKMADDLGRTFDEWVKGGKAGKAYNAEELRALRNAVGAQAKTVSDLSAEVSAARTAGNLTDNVLVKQFAEGQKLQALTQLAEGARAEWGRAGRSFRDATRLVDLPPDQATARIYKMVGGRDNALAALAEYQKLLDSGAGVVAQAKFWSGVKNPPAGVEDWFRLLRYNSMLSGPRTFEVNIIGNSLEVPWRLARDTIASTLRGNPREMAPEISGMMAGFAKGRAKFLEVMSEGVTTERALAGDLPRSVSDRVKNPIGKAAAGILEQPGRMMQGMDEWASAMAHQMAMGRRAGVQATREGVKGKAWDARVAELLADPTLSMQKDAAAVAERMVYHGDMGTLGRALEQVQKVPYLGGILLPFLRTVYHISARGIDRSPLGLAGTAFDVARGVYGPRNLRSLGRALGGETAKELPKGVVPLGERLGDNLIGTAAWTGFYMKSMEGNISGAGPDDPEKRDMLRAQGWQPYSVKIGDHWVSYSNWGPVAISLASAAGAAEAQTFHKSGADIGSMITDGMRRTAQLATEQSYLSGIGAVWKGLSEPDRYGSQFVGQFMTSLIPYGSALNTVGQATDTVMRTPARDNFADFVKQSTAARLPFLREGVPSSQDQLGRPIPNEASGFGAANPLRTSTIRSNVVLQELLANGADVGDPPKAFHSVPLTPAEQREMNTASGTYIEQAVRTLMRDPDYRNFGPEQKQQSLQRAIAAARAAAGGEIMQRLGDAEITRRVEGERGKKVPVPIGQ